LAPASAGLIILRRPLIAFLYERGQFDAQMTELVSWALLWYALGLVGHSMLDVLTRAFYAQQDTRTPVVVGACAMALNVLLSFSFSAIFARLGWMPHGGLALANSVATALEMGALYILMRRRLNTMDDRGIGTGAVHTGVGVIVMSAALAGFARLGLPVWAAALGGVAAGASIYLIVLRLLRVPELTAVYSDLARRLRRGA